MVSPRLFCRLALSFVFMLVLGKGAVEAAPGEQLRIETEVFLGEDPQPVSRTVTLFDTTTVYEFVEEKQVFVFRPPTSAHDGQFILLDLSSKQRTEVSTVRIGKLMEKVKRWAGEQEDELLRFSADPQFEESYDKESGVLTLNHPLWKYSVATIQADDKVALHRYREFTDWYTQLNAMLYSTPPPGARLRLNAVLELHGVMPVEVRRTSESDSQSLRATHLFAWRLSREDRTRINQAQNYLANFEKVDNESFLASRAKENVVRGQSR